MVFTSFTYLWFLLVVVALYWALRERRAQNVLLLVASYLFYGWVHPWFCILIGASTAIDYACALGMGGAARRRRALLTASVAANLGLLATFKYLGFFVESWDAALRLVGLETSPHGLRIFLPVGISFYTFQSVGYVVDVYRGAIQPRRSFVDFALFVSCFPQLVAGPIERASAFLPQLETPRRWDASVFAAALPLLLRGYVKKLLVADNVAVYVDQIFALRSPAAPLLLAGGVAFAVQIYADFSGYTDIARGSARLLGLRLSENFRSPYAAISPSDFWRRWHVSLSSWITDCLYIPLGGSRVRGAHRELGVLLVTMALAGLWHGAAWNFVAWGVFHAALLFAYRRLGLGADWRPSSRAGRAAAVAAMFSATVGGWILFRAPSLGWLASALGDRRAGWASDDALVTAVVVALVALYSLPLMFLRWQQEHGREHPVLQAALAGTAVVALALFARENVRNFIYFQF
jgi:D-alanyl-lipoteichoic acid acyltransferase DltB (MBOAT superfamily)